jgi:hypothetical protein
MFTKKMIMRTMGIMMMMGTMMVALVFDDHESQKLRSTKVEKQIVTMSSWIKRGAFK